MSQETPSQSVEKQQRERNALGTELGFGTPRNVSQFRPIGGAGTAIYSGYIVELERNAQLIGTTKYRVFSDNFINIPTISASVRAFLDMIAKPEWRVIPADKDNETAVEYAEFVTKVINELVTPWHRIIRRMATYRFYGYSVHEWTFKRMDDGRIGYLDIAVRPQKTIELWDTDFSGNVLGCVQLAPQNNEYIHLPRERLIYIVDNSMSDSPEGLGMFRCIVATAARLKRYEQLEGFGYETDLRGVPVGRAPLAELQQLVAQGRLTEQERSQLLDPLTTFIEKHIRTPQLGLLIDSQPFASLDEASTPSNVQQWGIELLQSTNNSSAEAIARAIQREKHDIARVIGNEGQLLGTGERGSQALARDKTESFVLTAESTLLEISKVLNKDFINPIMQINGFDMNLKPTLQFAKVKHQDVRLITEALNNMARAGAVIMPGDPVINEVRNIVGLSDAPKMVDLDMVPPMMQQPPQGENEQGAENGASSRN